MSVVLRDVFRTLPFASSALSDFWTILARLTCLFTSALLSTSSTVFDAFSSTLAETLSFVLFDFWSEAETLVLFDAFEAALRSTRFFVLTGKLYTFFHLRLIFLRTLVAGSPGGGRGSLVLLGDLPRADFALPLDADSLDTLRDFLVRFLAQLGFFSVVALACLDGDDSLRFEGLLLVDRS